MTDPASTSAPRVRFAPSPTGYFHVGSARSALFNWLFARQHHGTFILRIEDTDEERNRPEWAEGIVSALDWLGMPPDEGPYFQSAQGEAHQAAIDALWASGALYACDCTREEIDERTRQRAAAGDPTPGYDGFCRTRGLARGEGRSLRFRTPDEGTTTVVDLVRGVVEFPNRSTEDFICVKGNGKPLFVLANAVDDRTMSISHVLRGEDLFPTTPKQLMLWQALNVAEDSDVPLAHVSRTCHCWSTRGGRSFPSGATRWRSRCTGSRAISPRPSATIWRSWVGVPAKRRRCRWRRSSSVSGSRTCSGRRPSSMCRSSRT